MKKIRIATESGTALVNAVVYGAWAAHRQWHADDDDWIVTHVESGLCVGKLYPLAPEDAVAAAERLELSGLRTLDDVRGQRHLIEALIAEVIA